MSQFPANPGPLPVLKLCDPKPQFGTEPGDGALNTGDRRKDLVEHLQQMLRDLSLPIGESGPQNDGIDGEFGQKTKTAVTSFQENNQHVDGNPLTQDGMVGPRTADSLNRKMVGKWYDLYETPRELTNDHLLITATTAALKNNINVEPNELKNIKLLLVDIRPFRIKLFESDGDAFVFEGEGDFELFDADGKVVAAGKVNGGEDIVTFASSDPVNVELTIEQNKFKFPVD